MNHVCCCSNPDCIANGCGVVRRLQQAHSEQQSPTHQFGFGTFTPHPLTADDIRRIVREEIARAQPSAHKER